LKVNQAYADALALLKVREQRILELETENARLNMEMTAYREKLTPDDAAAMVAVINSLYIAKIVAPKSN
jgi:hypothetical protein